MSQVNKKKEEKKLTRIYNPVTGTYYNIPLYKMSKPKVHKECKQKTEKTKLVEVWEEWREGWASPDLFIYVGKGKLKEKLMLREHTTGEYPFVKMTIEGERIK